jgi:hypothetical protein
MKHKMGEKTGPARTSFFTHLVFLEKHRLLLSDRRILRYGGNFMRGWMSVEREKRLARVACHKTPGSGLATFLFPVQIRDAPFSSTDVHEQTRPIVLRPSSESRTYTKSCIL